MIKQRVDYLEKGLKRFDTAMSFDLGIIKNNKYVYTRSVDSGSAESETLFSSCFVLHCLWLIL